MLVQKIRHVRPGPDGETLTDALRLIAAPAVLTPALLRLQRGEQPVAPDGKADHAADMLRMLKVSVPSPALAKALDTYLVTVCDHGLNASTFATRVVASTLAGLTSSVLAGLGALKGPLHGGAPGPALDMVFEIGDASRAESVLRRKLEGGERLMGFGHRIYKVRDPRADVLAAAAARMFSRAGDLELYELARAVETKALELLEEYKPGRRIKTNVEFYTALLLCGLDLDTAFFAPTFAIGRVAGWTAHCFEQRALGRLIRPQSAYVGRIPA